MLRRTPNFPTNVEREAFVTGDGDLGRVTAAMIAAARVEARAS